MEATKNITLKQGTKEWYELLEFFERNLQKVTYMTSLEREQKQYWEKGHIYCNGIVNEYFKVFLWGYSHGKCEMLDF